MLEIAPISHVSKEIEKENSEDYGMVKVFMQDFTYMSITESPAYEVSTVCLVSVCDDEVE